MGLQGVRRLDLLGVPQFTRVDIAIANKHFGSGKKKLRIPEAPARRICSCCQSK